MPHDWSEMKRTGLVLSELLVVLLLISIVGLWQAFRPAASLATDARSVAGAVTRARASAVVGGTVTTVFGAACSPRPAAALQGLTKATVSAPKRGLQFTPNGLPRTCDGGGVGNATILLERRGRQAAVIVSSLGRVRWEMR